MCPFHLRKEKKSAKMAYLDVEIPRGNGKFVATVYRRPTFLYSF